MAERHQGRYSTERIAGGDVLALALIALGGLGLRLWGLGSESIWLDEATSYVLARMPIPEMVRWTAVDIHPPLYYALLHFWLALGHGEAQVRLLSVVFGVCSILMLYLLAHRLLGRSVAIAAAALLAASPLHVWYSQETRMYAMLAFLALATTYCMVRALLDDRPAAWAAYVLMAVAALYTHYYAFFVLFFQAVIALYLLWRGIIARSACLRWLAAQALAVLAFAPWLPVLVSQVRGGGGSWVARSGIPGLRSLAETAMAFTVGPDGDAYSPLLRRLAYVAFWAPALLGAATALRRRRSASSAALAVIYLVVPLGAAWIISQVKPLYSLRYLLPFLPAYYILIGQGLALLRPESASRALPALWAVSLVGLCILGSFGIAHNGAARQQDDWRSVSSYVLERGQPADVVVFVPGWNSKPFDYYADGAMALVSDTPIPIRAQDVPALVDQAGRGRSRIWLVQAAGHYADPQGLLGTYLDQTSKRLERREFPKQIIVTLYALGR